jgi:hypothetical protein
MDPTSHSSNSQVIDSSRDQRVCDEFLARAQRRIRTSLAQAQSAIKTLSKMEKTFAASKSGKEEDSLFTRENVRAMIDVFQKNFPEDKGFIDVLKRMEPLTAKPFKELKSHPKPKPPRPGAILSQLLPASKPIFEKMWSGTPKAETAADKTAKTNSRKLVSKVKLRPTI